MGFFDEKVDRWGRETVATLSTKEIGKYALNGIFCCKAFLRASTGYEIVRTTLEKRAPAIPPKVIKKTPQKWVFLWLSMKWWCGLETVMILRIQKTIDLYSYAVITIVVRKRTYSFIFLFLSLCFRNNTILWVKFWTLFDF